MEGKKSCFNCKNANINPGHDGGRYEPPEPRHIEECLAKGLTDELIDKLDEIEWNEAKCPEICGEYRPIIDSGEVCEMLIPKSARVYRTCEPAMPINKVEMPYTITIKVGELYWLKPDEGSQGLEEHVVTVTEMALGMDKVEDIKRWCEESPIEYTEEEVETCFYNGIWVYFKYWMKTTDRDQYYLPLDVFIDLVSNR